MARALDDLRVSGMDYQQWTALIAARPLVVISVDDEDGWVSIYRHRIDGTGAFVVTENVDGP